MPAQVSLGRLGTRGTPVFRAPASRLSRSQAETIRRRKLRCSFHSRTMEHLQGVGVSCSSQQQSLMNALSRAEYFPRPPCPHCRRIPQHRSGQLPGALRAIPWQQHLASSNARGLENLRLVKRMQTYFRPAPGLHRQKIPRTLAGTHPAVAPHPDQPAISICSQYFFR
jgi:hypothetical protein